jgi:hypothetical protein
MHAKLENGFEISRPRHALKFIVASEYVSTGAVEGFTSYFRQTNKQARQDMETVQD